MVENKKKKTQKKTEKKKESHHKDVKSETKKVHKEVKNEKNKESVKDEHKTVKTNKTKLKKRVNRKNLVITLLLIIMIFVVSVIGYKFYVLKDNNNLKHNINISLENKNGSVTLLVVEDPSCKDCGVDYFADQVKTNLIPNLILKKVDYESDLGKAIIAELNLKQVPTFLFSEGISKRDDWESKLKKAFIEVSLDNKTFYELNPQFVSNKIVLEEPKILKDAIIIGNKNAPVTLYYFTDFECPFCAIAENNSEMVEQFKTRIPTYVSPIPKIMRNYVDAGKVKIVFYNNPIEMLHPKVRVIHLAALCANEQNKFAEFERNIWNKRSDWINAENRTEKMFDYAKDLGLNLNQFKKCLASKKYDSKIEEDLALSRKYNIMGTPSFFVNRRFITGARNYSYFKNIIDNELSKINN